MAEKAGEPSNEPARNPIADAQSASSFRVGDRQPAFGVEIPSSANYVIPAGGGEPGKASGHFQQQMIQASVTMSAASLPFIPPDVIEDYNRVYPGLVNRFIDWTETQQAHRLRLEVIRNERSEVRLDRAQIGTAITAGGGLLIAGLVGVFGSPMAASVIAIVAVGGPVAASILANRFGVPSSPPVLPTVPTPTTTPPQHEAPSPSTPKPAAE